MSDKHFVGLDLTSFEDNKLMRPISRVTLLVDDENAITAGDDTGYEIVSDCPHATQAMVNSQLERLKGYQYHPFVAENSNLDPAAELGDGVTANGVYSVLARLNDDGSGYANISAPGEAEMYDEYPSTGPMTQEFNRKIAETRSEIAKTSEKISLRVEQIEQQSKEDLANYAETVTASLGNLQSQIDGQIETFYYDYQPTLSNIPASEWKTETERAKHEGDLFYWKSKGYAYRFFKDGGTWKWQMVQDTDITAAMAQAAEAQDTADGKRRVFTTQPYPPYDVGDLWAQGSGGDLMRCNVARASGSYVESDWGKASKYTDDTVANQAISRAASLEISLDGITAQVSETITDLNGTKTRLSSIEQYVDSITLSVENDDASSFIRLMAGSTEISSQEIILKGVVTIQGLQNGTTTIDGACIKTGTISANRIDVDDLRIKTLYTSDNRTAIYSEGYISLHIGGNNAFNFNNVHLYANNTIQLGSFNNYSNTLTFDLNARSVHGNSTTRWSVGTLTAPFEYVYANHLTIRNSTAADTSGFFGTENGRLVMRPGSNVSSDIGTTSYYWDYAYIERVYLGSNCYLSASGSTLQINNQSISNYLDFKTDRLYVSDTNYVTLNSSHNLVPHSSASSYAYSLGSSLVPWYNCYLGAGTLQIGSSGTTSGTKIGFFGETPTTRKTLSTTSNNQGYSSVTDSNHLYILNNIVGILKAYGLIA